MAQIQANGIALEYERFGNPAQETIVLIRGLGTQMVEWSSTFIEALVQQQLSVVIFDNRDVGLSEKLTEPYVLRDMAADVAGLMDSLSIARAHIFGISLGGMVAQLVAVHFPERVHCLFSVMSSSGNPDLPPMPEAARQRLMAPAPSGGAEGAIQLTAANAEFFGSPGYPETLEVRVARARRAHERCYHPAGVSQQMQAVIADGSRVARLQQIVAPTLVIHGADDPLVEPHAGEDTAAHIPGALLQIIAGMGHNIPDALGPDIAQRVGAFVAAQRK